MVIDTEGYIHIIEYLTEHLYLFEQPCTKNAQSPTVIAFLEQELSEQIISVCAQNEELSFNQRNTIIREVDAVVNDLEEILSSISNNPISEQQMDFIKEFSLLIKNLFDTEINTTLINQ